MESPLLHCLTFLSLAIVASHAAISPEAYWKSELPYTSIPKAITDILPSAEWVEEKSTSVTLQNGGKVQQTPKIFSASVNQLIDNPAAIKAIVQPTPKIPFNWWYHYAADGDQLLHNPDAKLFLLGKDVTLGTKINLQFIKSSNPSTFLPRQEADLIPFSSEMVPEILKMFSVDPNTVEAKIIKDAIIGCQVKGFGKEDRYCATSLESMVDFITSKLGKKVEALSTEVQNEEMQEYTIVGLKKLVGNNAVVCHKQNYPYAVFICHQTVGTTVYKVSLLGADDGKITKAVVVCHADTSSWNPKHISFQMLNVEPGTVPIAHFLHEDHLVWVALQEKITHDSY